MAELALDVPALDGPGVDVRVGKPLDALALKGASLAETRAYAAGMRDAVEALYAPGREVVAVEACPACARPCADAGEALAVHGVAYLRCAACGHLFVGARPTDEALAQHFVESDDLAAPYVERDSLELRLASVVGPKADWALEAFGRTLGRAARSAVDVGAGGGHTVEALRRRGLDAHGYELSRASRAFAAAAFGLELRADDFLAARPEPVDVVTLFGLLEYAPEPAAFLDVAARWAPDGMVVVEVPRADCLGTAVQALPGAVVARHLDPASHVNCFSDASLAALLARTGWRPVAAWWFGLDAYELLVQLAHRLDDEAAVARLADAVLALQPALDAARLCDDLVVCAVRERRA